VNPFNLNTDNLTRIAEFNLLLPKRQLLKLTETRGAEEPKERIALCDYQLFWETLDEVKRRIYDATGLAGLNYLPTCETIN
jgi:hypothetical protein